MSRSENTRRELRGLMQSIRHGGGPRAARAALKAPLIERASAAMREVRTLPLPAAMAELGIDHLRIDGDASSRHAWQIGAVEQALLFGAAHSRAVSRAFELGTFDGGTTLTLARALGPGHEVHTIDLPDDRFAETQGPQDFSAKDVGRAFRDVPTHDLATIVSHRADTTTFDFSPWHAKIDLVLVDGAHDYEHGVADSRTALDLVAPGGVVFWDDMEPYWHGLVTGVLETVDPARLTKVARTSLMYYIAKP